MIPLLFRGISLAKTALLATKGHECHWYETTHQNMVAIKLKTVIDFVSWENQHYSSSSSGIIDIEYYRILKLDVKCRKEDLLNCYGIFFTSSFFVDGLHLHGAPPEAPLIHHFTLTLTHRWVADAMQGYFNTRTIRTLQSSHAACSSNLDMAAVVKEVLGCLFKAVIGNQSSDYFDGVIRLHCNTHTQTGSLRQTDRGWREDRRRNTPTD